MLKIFITIFLVFIVYQIIMGFHSFFFGLKKVDEKFGVYYYDGGNIVYCSVNNCDGFSLFFHGRKHVLKGADKKSFKVLSSSYGRDKNNIYYYDEIIAGIDKESFEILGSGYSKDKFNIFYEEKKIPSVDIKTFKLIKNLEKGETISYYARDKNKINGADLTSFELLKDDLLYSKDKNNIYYEGKIIEGADLESFELIKDIYFIGYLYSKDKKNIYYNGKKIEGAKPDDINTFYDNLNNNKKETSHFFIKSNNKVFAKGIEVKGLDINNLKVIGTSINDGKYEFVIGGKGLELYNKNY